MATITRTGRVIILLAAALALGILLPIPASATEGAPPSSPSTDPPPKFPTLNGHAFMTVRDIPDPFIRTNFRSTLGVGVSKNYQSSTLVIGGKEVITFGGDLVYANLGFRYQQAISPWLALQFGTDITGRLGTGLKAILIEGVRASSTGQASWLVRILQTDQLCLSGSLGVSNNSTTRMDPVGFVNDVVDSGGVTDSTQKLVSTTPTLLAMMGFHGAYGVSETVGLLGFVEGSAGDSYDRKSRNELYAAGGIAVDIALHRWLHAPLSLVAGYRMENYPETGDEKKALNYSNVAQVGYLSPGGLILSLDLTYKWLTNRETSKGLNVVWPVFTMKYYF
jgi:hypothetical protein